MNLLSGIRETENVHLENLHDDGKTKLSSDWGDYREKGKIKDEMEVHFSLRCGKPQMTNPIREF